MARTKLSDEKLSAILAKAVSNSEHLTDGKLAKEWEEVNRYYRGELPAPLHKGDSKYVSRDVFDAVDSMRSTVLEAFSANQRIVMFRPERGETADEAKQATEYCRHVFFKENSGEDILYDVLSDGLKHRFSVVKVYYEDDSEEQEYDFDNLTEDELVVQLDEYDDYEITESSISEEGLYSGSFTVKTKNQRIVVEAIQPEDFLVANNSSSLKEAKYVIHRTPKTRSYFIKTYGKKSVEGMNFHTDNTLTFETVKQTRFDTIGQVLASSDGYDESVEETILYEIYIHLDMDGSGISKLWKIDYAEGKVFRKEQVSRKPFASFVPLPVSHTYYGENFAQSVIPTQNARTVLIRQIINHTLITNNPRNQVLNGTLLSPQELLENRLGGIINVRRMDGIAPIPQAPMNPFVFSLIQMIDEDKEEVTGISKLSQGLNKDAISTQNSEGMVEQLISASQQRTKIISRRFGLFIRDLYHLIYHTAVDHIDEAEFMETTGTYVPVNPSLWKERSAASVELTLSYGEQEKEAMKWIEVDAALSQDPELKPMYSIDKRYEVITRAMQARGIEDIQSILMKPSEVEPQQPSEMEMLQIEQLKSQIEYQKAQAQAMISKAETDRIKAQADLIRAQAEAGYKQVDSALEMKRLDNDIFVDREELALAGKAAEQKAVYNP
jgi:hypothetical protein